jgi:hypothetical protein
MSDTCRVAANKPVLGVLDLRVRDPDRSSPWLERFPRRRNPMALQSGDCARCSQHVGDHGQGRLRCIHRLLLLLLLHVRVRLVPGP